MTTVELTEDERVMGTCRVMEFAEDNIALLPPPCAEFVRRYFAEVDAQLAAFVMRRGRFPSTLPRVLSLKRLLPAVRPSA